MPEEIGSEKTRAEKSKERTVMIRPPPDTAAELSRFDAPRGNLLMVAVPLLGFILAMMLALSFALALGGGAAADIGQALHGGGSPLRTVIFVL